MKPLNATCIFRSHHILLDTLKPIVLEAGVPTVGIPSHTDNMPSCSAGTFAGLMQTAITTPTELLKIRLQLQTQLPGSPGYVGPVRLLKQVVMREGITGRLALPLQLGSCSYGGIIRSDCTPNPHLQETCSILAQTRLRVQDNVQSTLLAKCMEH